MVHTMMNGIDSHITKYRVDNSTRRVCTIFVVHIVRTYTRKLSISFEETKAITLSILN